MPMPLWWGHVNKRIFNPRELRKGQRPVIEHVGRSSGKPYRTPLDAHEVEGGFIFILVYGSGSDWVQNTLAAGNAQLTKDGKQFELTNPRIVDTDAAWSQLPPDTGAPPGFLNVGEYLQMDHAA